MTLSFSVSAAVWPGRKLAISLLACLALGLPGLVKAQGAAGAPPVPAYASMSPEQLITTVSQDILDIIKKDRSLQSGDIKRLNQLVDDRVLPVVNFQRMTALTVGPPWRSATDEQRARMVALFREQLTLQYADALRLVQDTKIQLKPGRYKPEDTDVIVRTEVIRPGKEPIQLDYRLQKTPDGWKVYDFNVLGLWFVEHYRGQFSQTLATKGINGLIAELEQRNGELRKKTAMAQR